MTELGVQYKLADTKCRVPARASCHTSSYDILPELVGLGTRTHSSITVDLLLVAVCAPDEKINTEQIPRPPTALFLWIYFHGSFRQLPWR